MKITRRKSRQVKIGDVAIGGDHPIAVQSMCSTKTHKVKETVNQINRMIEVGADIVRVAVPDERAVNALTEIIPECPVPLVADIHFNYRLALEAADAGVQRADVISVLQKVHAILDNSNITGPPISLLSVLQMFPSEGEDSLEAKMSELRHWPKEARDLKDLAIDFQDRSMHVYLRCQDAGTARISHDLDSFESGFAGQLKQNDYTF